jgi:tetratricopeptide (TPR) repeat protein
LNIAACYIKSKDFESAYEAANEALKLDPYNIKALYRRARAKALPINSGVEDFRAALIDLKQITEVDPNNIPVQRELRRL